MRALISVWDKTGLEGFAAGLVRLGWTLYSTGQTHAALEAAGLPVRSVSELTGFPEILDGRVKTLHPGVHAGILARRDDAAHAAQLAEHGIGTIDLVVSNLYPFVDTVARVGTPAGALAPEATAEGPSRTGGWAGPLPPAVLEAVEHIDVGGPAMIRAAAKNFLSVLVVAGAHNYGPLLAALEAGGPAAVPRSLRARLAQEAFAHTAQYDAYVAQYFAALTGDAFPAQQSLPLARVSGLSYGENPHQRAAFYRLGDPRLTGPGLPDLEQLNGDAPSYNNLLDLDAAYAIVADFDTPAAAVVKHNNPCGVGTAASLEVAYRKAFAGDPLSAFGGVVSFNREVDEATAQAMRGTLYWVIVAPGYSPQALRVLRRYKKRTRVFRLPPLERKTTALPGFALHYRAVAGGFLAQTPDAVPEPDVTFTVVSKRPPSEAELADLRFAWRVVKHVRSNASVFARDGSVVAAGAGQMSRVDSVVAATHVARRSAPDGAALPAEGSVMATDGFFPFPDAVEAAAAAGATAIAHPGGSKEDEAAVEAADRLDLAMVVTGYRHFRH